MSTARAKRRPAPPAPEKSADDLPYLRDYPPLRLPTSAATLGGFRAWATSERFPEGLRATFIDGEIILDMSPEELQTHIVVKYEVARVLLNLNRESKLGTFFGDGALITNEAADLATEPDGTFLTRDSLRTGRARLVPREGTPGQSMEIEGTPDWVMEVVSRYSVQKDTELMRQAYHRAGIAEYWLIDARGEEIGFRILHRGEGGYEPAPLRAGWQRSRTFGRSFRLDREREDLGLWEYTLRVK